MSEIMLPFSANTADDFARLSRVFAFLAADLKGSTAPVAERINYLEESHFAPEPKRGRTVDEVVAAMSPENQARVEARTAELVAEVEQPKRKRRTKAEIEAEKAAAILEPIGVPGDDLYIGNEDDVTAEMVAALPEALEQVEAEEAVEPEYVAEVTPRFEGEPAPGFEPTPVEEPIQEVTEETLRAALKSLANTIGFEPARQIMLSTGYTRVQDVPVGERLAVLATINAAG